jgi:hypothetical protein
VIRVYVSRDIPADARRAVPTELEGEPVEIVEEVVEDPQ